jgi:hypothetical protein
LISIVMAILLTLLASDVNAQQARRAQGEGVLSEMTSWPPAVALSLRRVPLEALDSEPAGRWSEVAAAGRRSCLRGALIGGGVGAGISLGYLALNSDGDLFEGSRERNFALITVGAGALIGCALASD